METIAKAQKQLSGIMFKAAWLLTFVLIEATGKYRVKVFSDTTEANFVAGEEGKNGKYITTLRAIAPDQVENARKVFTNPDGSQKEEVPIEETNGLFMTLSTWEKSGYEKDKIPMKNEEIEILVELVDNADKTAKVLRAQNHRLLGAKNAPKVGVGFLLPAQNEATKAKEAKAAAVNGELVHS